MKKIVAILLVIVMLFSCGAILTSCGDDDNDGGRCRFCGTHTNWTYKGGGYVCYSCYKKYYK